jgi:hypothetical protein
MSPPRLPRKVLAAAVLMGGLILPIPARAAVVRHPAAGPAALESSIGIVLHWFSHFWSAAFEKNGAQTDPNGGTAPTANGATGTSGDHGAQIDPNG